MKQIPITWNYDGDFCSATFTEKTRKKYHCEGCNCHIQIGSSAWRVWVAGERTYSVCIACWDHYEECDICREEQAYWEAVAECRRESEAERGRKP